MCQKYRMKSRGIFVIAESEKTEIFLSEFLCREKGQIMLSMNVDKSFSTLLFIIN